MDMDDYFPALIFGFWVLLVVVMILVSRNSLRKLARERLLLFGGPREWREASVLEYPRLKLNFYDDCQAALEQAGFKPAGDMEDRTLAGSRQNPHTFRRVMLAGDGLATAEFWQINYPPWKQLFRMLFKGLGDARFIRVYVESRDGRLFETARAPVKTRDPDPQGFEVRYVDGKPGADEVWARFAGDFSEYQKAHPDFAALPFKFLDDVMASEKRQQERRVQLRKSVGLLTREDLLREGMPEKSVDSYLKAFNKQVRNLGGWPPA